MDTPVGQNGTGEVSCGQLLTARLFPIECLAAFLFPMPFVSVPDEVPDQAERGRPVDGEVKGGVRAPIVRNLLRVGCKVPRSKIEPQARLLDVEVTEAPIDPGFTLVAVERQSIADALLSVRSRRLNRRSDPSQRRLGACRCSRDVLIDASRWAHRIWKTGALLESCRRDSREVKVGLHRQTARHLRRRADLKDGGRGNKRSWMQRLTRVI